MKICSAILHRNIRDGFLQISAIQKILHTVFMQVAMHF